MIVMIIKKTDLYYKRAADKLTVLFPLSCLLNIAWIIAFSYVQIELSVIFILGLVLTLPLICKQLLKHTRRRTLAAAIELWATC